MQKQYQVIDFLMSAHEKRVNLEIELLQEECSCRLGFDVKEAMKKTN